MGAASFVSVLSDRSIIDAVSSGLLIIRPFNLKHVQPSSYDLTLRGPEPLVLEPFVLQLPSTEEWFEIPRHMQGQIHGRSSIGRLGVVVHLTAGLLDAGFKGRVTLECIAFDKPQTFYPGDRIAQVSFQWLDQPAEHPYSGRYQNQSEATPSRFKHARDEE